MSDDTPIKVVLCWHMHQPEYRDRLDGTYHLPWTYLHAIKDYVDMAVHIEQTPGARAVVNFSPLLLEQLDDYAIQVKSYLDEGQGIRDPLLNALAQPALPRENERRLLLIKSCMRANRERLINRFPTFQHLVEMASCLERHTSCATYLSDQYLIDLLVWYHLAWMGETVRRQDHRIQQLLTKESGYTLHDRLMLLQVIGELLAGVIPRYKQLAKEGKVELSVTPYAHPILPLLMELDSAKQALPDITLPLLERYPGGHDRAAWHIREAIQVFENHFGFTPKGCWPSEGGLSEDTLLQLTKAGLEWTASGEQVLRNSLASIPEEKREEYLHQAYRIHEDSIQCFFRDDGLSDLIGFRYASWHADHAVQDLIHHLEVIRQACQGNSGRVVSIILDGENAWEYYPENAYYFLSTLYQRLAEHPTIELTVFSDCLAQNHFRKLPKLVAGSWVYGTFSTWIGDEGKNRGWDMLSEAKRAFDRSLADGHLQGNRLAKAQRQLAICEGSDWFWWFGDYNPAETVQDFDCLYRHHLANLYQLISQEPPEYLAHSFSHGKGAPEQGGVMRRSKKP